MIQNINKKPVFFVGGLVILSVVGWGLLASPRAAEKANENATNVRRLCHLVEETGQYQELLLNANGWNGHTQHEKDLWDVKEGGCPQ